MGWGIGKIAHWAWNVWVSKMNLGVKQWEGNEGSRVCSLQEREVLFLIFFIIYDLTQIDVVLVRPSKKK